MQAFLYLKFLRKHNTTERIGADQIYMDYNN